MFSLVVKGKPFVGEYGRVRVSLSLGWGIRGDISVSACQIISRAFRGAADSSRTSNGLDNDDVLRRGEIRVEIKPQQLAEATQQVIIRC